MRECKRLTKEFDKEVKALENNFDRETNKMLNEKKQSMFKELNSYVALKKKHATNVDHKRIELFEGPNEGFGDEDQQMADAPDIAKPSAPAPASSSYSLESIFRQLSEMSTLQASRHKEVCSLIRNIDFRIQSMFKELNSYVALKKKHATNIDHKRIELSKGQMKVLETKTNKWQTPQT